MFVAFITAATFLIFFLFKYNYTKCLWAYMGFSGLLIFVAIKQQKSQFGVNGVMQLLGLQLGRDLFSILVARKADEVRT